MSIDDKIAKTEKYLRLLKAEKASQNGARTRKNNDTGTPIDYNYRYQYWLGKRDAKKDIMNDFDENKNGWTGARTGNLFNDVMARNDIQGEDEADAFNPYACHDSDDNVDEEFKEDDDDGYVNHVFF